MFTLKLTLVACVFILPLASGHLREWGRRMSFGGSMFGGSGGFPGQGQWGAQAGGFAGQGQWGGQGGGFPMNSFDGFNFNGGNNMDPSMGGQFGGTGMNGQWNSFAQTGGQWAPGGGMTGIVDPSFNQFVQIPNNNGMNFDNGMGGTSGAFVQPGFGQGFQGSGMGFSNNGMGFGNNGMGFSNNGMGFDNNGMGFGNNGMGFGNNGMGFGNNGMGFDNNGMGFGNNGMGFANNGMGTTSNGMGKKKRK